MSNGYDRVGTLGPQDQSGHGLQPNGVKQRSLASDNLVLISKVPTKRRDNEYGIAFGVCMMLIFILSFVTNPNDLNPAFISAGQIGSWISMVMIATMLGTFIGMGISIFLYFTDLRERIMNLSIVIAIFLQIGLAIIIFIADEWIFLGVGCLCSALIDFIKFTKSKRYMAISSELVQMAIDINFRFGASVVIFSICVGAVQCCVLLWWSAAFVKIMSNNLNAGVIIVGIVFILSLYWIVQLFHSLVSCVVSGCVLWYFCDDGNNMDPNAPTTAEGAGKHVVLYLKCALSSSFGSVCKAALYGPLSHIVVSSLHWSREHYPFG